MALHGLSFKCLELPLGFSILTFESIKQTCKKGKLTARTNTAVNTSSKHLTPKEFQE